MPRRKISQGQCQFCQELVTKTAATRHLAKCEARQAALAKAEKQFVPEEPLFYLRAQANGAPEFWLDLEVKGNATLASLDNYLRAIWLECCDHLSQFGDFGEDELPMTGKLSRYLPVAASTLHLYDFGSTSETVIKSVSSRIGKPLTKHPIALLFRNALPEVECIECKAPATHFCEECRIEEDSPGWLCDEHAEDHPHDQYGEPMPLVNSPRSGMCGYDGPAEPPY